MKNSHLNEDDIECQHIQQNKGVCMDCGQCVELCEFRDSYTETHNYVSQFHLKYSFKDPLKQYLSKIKKILLPLNLESYVHPVNNLLLKTEFKGRLSTEDKIILALLNISKMNSFPISIQDLMKYSNTSKYRLLKIYRDTFEFVEKSECYFQGIFERTMNSLKKNGIAIGDGVFEELFLLRDKFKSTNPKLLCIAYFYEKYNISSSKIKNIDEFKYAQVQYVRKKMRNINKST